MRLLIANFDAQEIVTREQVVEAVLRLPAPHIHGIQVVRYDPRREIATTLSYLEERPTVVSSHGLFFHDRETAVIVLFQFDSVAGFLHVLYHEVGHYVFLRVLTQEQRDDWMYRVRRRESAGVTAYARRNAREDFAETYAFHYTGRLAGAGFPLRAAFFSQSVFRDGPRL